MNYNHEEYKKRAKLLIEEGKGFMVVLSNKDVIKVDGDEIKAITEAIKTGSVIKVRQGIINPSFIISVVEDSRRNRDWYENIHNVIKHNEFLINCGDTEGFRKLPEIQKLRDIFSSTLPPSNKIIPQNNNQFKGI